MAGNFQPNPEILVFGTVKAVHERTKYNEDPNAPRVPNGREVVILANSGFLNVRIPATVTFDVEIDQEVFWSLDFNQWLRSDAKSGEVKNGTTLTYKNQITIAALAGYEAAIAA